MTAHRLSPCWLFRSGVCAVLLGWSLLPTSAVAQSCPPSARASLSFEVALAPIERNDGLSIAQLARQPGRAPGPAGSARGHVLGLTQARYGEQSQISAQFQPMSDGSFCASLKTMTVSFGFQQRVVLVARELPTASCIFREVLEHEMKHIAVDEALLREAAPQIRRRLEETLAQFEPVRVRGENQAMQAFRRRLDATMRAIMQEFGRERDQRQAQVDTAEEYERVSKSCGGEVRDYLPKPNPTNRRTG
ncbi:hypothetical protein [Azospirillum griseum]|uniref:DUF922 domain-containing protein n=1 Tax=Azospirillum griseum TaxID=2496639 RepID=A0A431VFJ6_9PROT|nr:hypothetical protein [Azospirillum griseum]RTR19136.1 hypothetical protein EJ903_13965 [Azospirillum griseum]